MINDFFEDMKIEILSISIAVLVIIFILLDGLMSKQEQFYGNIVDKHYKAENISVGSGTAVGSNGNVSVVTTTEYAPEKFLIIVKLQSGEMVTVECESKLYYKKEIGQSIECNSYKGFFTGLVWSLRGVK